MITLFMFGSCIGYQVIITELLQYSFKEFGMSEETVNGNEFILIQSGAMALFVLLPMSLMTDMSAFRYASLASIGALVYVGIVLLIELPKYFNWYYDDA